MTTIVSIGMNHETAPVYLRERLAAEPGNVPKALHALRTLDCIKEGLFVSTCNRVEFLITTDRKTDAVNAVTALMCRLGGTAPETLSPSLYTYEGSGAVRHTFRVGSSLDSMIVGEPQILGQIKEAYSRAVQEKTTGVILNRLLHKTFHVAKRVRSETAICESAVSVSYAATELAKKIFHELEGKAVLLLGAGEMAELAAKHLLRHGVSSITVANRTFSRAIHVAEEFKGTPVSFDEIGSQLLKTDIVISSTGSEEYVVTYPQVKRSLRKRRNRPLFFIDIAVPRDIQPEVNNLDNVYVYDIDDLRGIARENLIQRQEEAHKAERIVEEEVIKFDKWLSTLYVVPTIISLQEKAKAIVDAELKKVYSAFEELTPSQQRALQTFAWSITNKMLNDPILFLKRKAGRATLNNYLDITRKLFNLDEEAQAVQEETEKGG